MSGRTNTTNTELAIIGQVAHAFVLDVVARREVVRHEPALNILDAIVGDWLGLSHDDVATTDGEGAPATNDDGARALLKVAHDMLPLCHMLAATDFGQSDSGASFLCAQERSLSGLLNAAQAIQRQ